jgi:hypothetical protein
MVSSLAGSDMSPPAVQPLTSKPGPAPFPKLASRRLPAVNDKSSHHAQPKPTPSATACNIQSWAISGQGAFVAATTNG